MIFNANPSRLLIQAMNMMLPKMEASYVMEIVTCWNLEKHLPILIERRRSRRIERRHPPPRFPQMLGLFSIFTPITSQEQRTAWRLDTYRMLEAVVERYHIGVLR